MSALSDKVKAANDALQKNLSAALATKQFGQAVTDWVLATDPTTPPPPPPSGVLPRYGISNGGLFMDRRSNAEIVQELDGIREMGGRLIRYDCLESAAYQTKFAFALAEAKKRGLAVIACLRGTSGPYGADKASAFATACAKSAYGPLVDAWEYANEPNLGAPRYPAQTYAQEMVAAFSALRSVLPNAVRVAGTLGWDSDGDFSSYWPTVLANSRGHFDMVSLHLYSVPTFRNWTEAFKLDYDGKPVVVTEAGSNADEATQAAVVRAALKDPRVAAVCIYAYRNDLPGYGMVTDTWAKKQAWFAYQGVAA